MCTRPPHYLVLVALGGVALRVAGCDGDGPTPPPPPPPPSVAGSWAATSYSVDGTDAVERGTDVRLTFVQESTRADATGTWSLAISNDTDGLCDPGPNCETSGSYQQTDDQLILDQGLPTELTWAYTATQTSLTIDGTDSAGRMIVATFEESAPATLSVDGTAVEIVCTQYTPDGVGGAFVVLYWLDGQVPYGAGLYFPASELTSGATLDLGSPDCSAGGPPVGSFGTYSSPGMGNDYYSCLPGGCGLCELSLVTTESIVGTFDFVAVVPDGSDSVRVQGSLQLDRSLTEDPPDCLRLVQGGVRAASPRQPGPG